MTVTYTPNLGFTKPDFDHRNWHLDLNNGAIELIEEALSGVFVKAITGSDTLLITDGLTSEGRHALVEFTGVVTPPAIITVPNVEKFWVFLNNTDQVLTIDNGTGGTITVAINSYALCYNDGTDVFKIFEINKNSPELGIVATLLSDKSFKEQFDNFDTSLWTQFQSLASTTAVITADDDGNRKSAYGGSFLRLTQRAGYYFTPLPFNRDAIYKISIRMRQHANGSGGHTVYAGVVGIAADGVTFVDTAGGSLTHPDNQHMVAVRQLQLDSDIPGTYSYFEGYILGSDIAGDVGPENDANAAGKVHEDVRYIAPAFTVNWDSVDAVCDIDSVEFDILDKRNVPNGVLAFGEDSKADSTGRGAMLSQLGLEQNTLLMTENITLTDDPTSDVDALGKAVQILDPDAASRNVDLPIVLTQPISYHIYNDGEAIEELVVRANAADEVITLFPGEWVWLVAKNLTPTAAADWRVLAKSAQYRTLAGSGTLRVPQGVSSIDVLQVVGGGGGGGGSLAVGGGGGGGGAAGRESIAVQVVPGSDQAWIVGGGGGGGAVGVAGANGIASTFLGLTAPAGAGGAAGLSGTAVGGAGGQNGGNEGNGAVGGNGEDSGDFGTNGGTGPYAAGGASPAATRSGGGGGGSFAAGGDGGGSAAPGSNGAGPGGGGGGGGGLTTPAIGGNGAVGTIVIRF